MKSLSKIVDLLENCGIKITNDYGNMKDFNVIMSDLGKEWNKLAKNESCLHRYSIINTYSQPTTDGDTMYWTEYECFLCGNHKTEMR